MSSHREAPEISQDPVADSTDVYAFVSPDRPGTVTLIANYIPLQGPAGGPNFYAFGDDVLYEIHVDNNGDAEPDVTYQFKFRTELADKDTFLYNTGPITSLGSANWNRRQTYKVTRVNGNKSTVLANQAFTASWQYSPQPRIEVSPVRPHAWLSSKGEIKTNEPVSYFNVKLDGFCRYGPSPGQHGCEFNIAKHASSSHAVFH